MSQNAAKSTKKCAETPFRLAESIGQTLDVHGNSGISFSQTCRRTVKMSGELEVRAHG